MDAMTTVEQTIQEMRRTAYQIDMGEGSAYAAQINAWADVLDRHLPQPLRLVEESDAASLRYQRDGLRDAARELLARLDRSPERILLTAAIAASEDK